MNLIRRQKQLYERTQQQSAAAETAARIMQQLSGSSSVGTPIGISRPVKVWMVMAVVVGVDADAMLAAQLMAQELEELDRFKQQQQAQQQQARVVVLVVAVRQGSSSKDRDRAVAEEEVEAVEVQASPL